MHILVVPLFQSILPSDIPARSSFEEVGGEIRQRELLTRPLSPSWRSTPLIVAKFALFKQYSFYPVQTTAVLCSIFTDLSILNLHVEAKGKSIRNLLQQRHDYLIYNSGLSWPRLPYDLSIRHFHNRGNLDLSYRLQSMSNHDDCAVAKESRKHFFLDISIRV